MNNIFDEDIVQEVDGFFYYYPRKVYGIYSAYLLREIADELDKRNEPIEKAIEDMMKTEDISK